MSIKDQFKRIKENWLILILLLVVVGIVAGPISLDNISVNSLTKSLGGGGVSYDIDDGYYAPTAMRSYASEGMMIQSADFAPEVEERKITKTANLRTEVEKGEFETSEQKLKDIFKSSSSFLLDENVNQYGTNKKEYYQGYYRIKVETTKYDSIIGQLKEIGEVQQFSENMDDVTGRYTNLEVELEAAKSRLAKYKQIYDESKSAEEKMEITDRIFNQERTIKYYEDSLSKIDKRISYSEISVTIQEKQSEYVDLILVKFSQLLKSLMGSINGLLTLIFVILPYLVAIGIIIVLVRTFRKDKRKRR